MRNIVELDPAVYKSRRDIHIYPPGLTYSPESEIAVINAIDNWTQRVLMIMRGSIEGEGDSPVLELKRSLNFLISWHLRISSGLKSGEMGVQPASPHHLAFVLDCIACSLDKEKMQPVLWVTLTGALVEFYNQIKKLGYNHSSSI